MSWSRQPITRSWDGNKLALLKKSGKVATEPLPLAADAITIYLASDDRAFDPEPGVHLTTEGFSPYLDEALTIPLYENQEGFAAERIIYSRIVGGTHHKADLNNAVFDLGSKMGLVGIVHDVRYAVDSDAIAVRAVANKTLFTAGYLPKRLAAVVTPLLWPGGAANAAVIETVSRGGARIGLKIVATVGRDMVAKQVSP
jgi:hypothetical protein